MASNQNDMKNNSQTVTVRNSQILHQNGKKNVLMTNIDKTNGSQQIKGAKMYVEVCRTIQHNGQRKKDKHYLQNTTQKTKD
jgi:hypothetical protein